MLFISPAYDILVYGVSKLPHRQSTIHYRSMLLLTTTILQCPSELSNELISLRSNNNVLISLWSKCNASLPAKGSVLTQMPSADAVSATSSASQNRYPRPWERGSKKGSENITIRPKGDKFGKQFEEHLNSSKNVKIYLVRLSDEGREQEKWIRQEPSNPI